MHVAGFIGEFFDRFVVAFVGHLVPPLIGSVRRVTHSNLDQQ